MSKRALFVGRFQPFHLGHEWLIREKLDKGVPVLIAIRDVQPDTENPLTAKASSEIIAQAFEEEDVQIIIIPDIESINWGRGVGYEVNEHIPPLSIHNISATQIRQEIASGSNAWQTKVNSKIINAIKIALTKPDMKTYRFYREEDKKWYIDLPEWTGSKADLQMVVGADDMLEMIGNNNSEVKLNISELPFEGASHLRLMFEGDEKDGGGYYSLERYPSTSTEVLNHELWLCDVTKFVFGYIPKNIYISKV